MFELYFYLIYCYDINMETHKAHHEVVFILPLLFSGVLV